MVPLCIGKFGEPIGSEEDDGVMDEWGYEGRSPSDRWM
jgi:hypothetical protein